MIPETKILLTETKIHDYVCEKFFICVRPFLSWLKKGGSYWFEYKGDDKYEVRSDNNRGETFEMVDYQLLTCFVPYKCLENIHDAIRHFHWLGELGIHHGYIDDFIKLCEDGEIMNKDYFNHPSEDVEKELMKWRHIHFHGRRDKHASGEYLERVSQSDLAHYIASWQKEVIISKAVKWLNQNVVEYHPRTGELKPVVNVNAFREAMNSESTNTDINENV